MPQPTPLTKCPLLWPPRGIVSNFVSIDKSCVIDSLTVDKSFSSTGYKPRETECYYYFLFNHYRQLPCASLSLSHSDRVALELQ